MNTFHVRKTGDVILLHLGKGDDMLQCLNQAITEHKDQKRSGCIYDWNVG